MQKEAVNMKMVVMFLTAVLFSGFAHAGQDRYGSMRPAVWRSSYTESADAFQVISTVPVVFHGVVIDTPSPNSFVAIYQSTMGTMLDGISTRAFADTSNSIPKIFDIVVTSHTAIQKGGTAKVNILYDYLIGPPAGITGNP